jgi:hypothetical protein
MVKYLSTIFKKNSFVKIPNLEVFLDHNNRWSWAIPMDCNFFLNHLLMFQ